MEDLSTISGGTMANPAIGSRATTNAEMVTAMTVMETTTATTGVIETGMVTTTTTTGPITNFGGAAGATNLTRSQRRDMERIDDDYDRFRIDPRDPRFRQMQRQKFGDMLSVMNPQQRSMVLSRVQPPRGQYGRGGGYGQPGYGPNDRSGSYGPYRGR